MPDNRPEQLAQAILAEVRKDKDGISALTLRERLTAQGYNQDEVQRAVRKLLDGGALVVGSGLRLESEAA